MALVRLTHSELSFLGLWTDMSRKRKARIQQSSVGVAFGALRINLESQ